MVSDTRKFYFSSQSSIGTQSNFACKKNSHCQYKMAKKDKYIFFVEPSSFNSSKNFPKTSWTSVQIKFVDGISSELLTYPETFFLPQIKKNLDGTSVEKNLDSRYALVKYCGSKKKIMNLCKQISLNISKKYYPIR